MQLELKVSNDSLLLLVQTGPLEKYDPKEHKEIEAIFNKVKKLDEDLKKMRAKIDPKLLEIKELVQTYNSSLNEQIKE